MEKQTLKDKLLMIPIAITVYPPLLCIGKLFIGMEKIRKKLVKHGFIEERHYYCPKTKKIKKEKF